jgi:hypothetical protein
LLCSLVVFPQLDNPRALHVNFFLWFLWFELLLDSQQGKASIWASYFLINISRMRVLGHICWARMYLQCHLHPETPASPRCNLLWSVGYLHLWVQWAPYVFPFHHSPMILSTALAVSYISLPIVGPFPLPYKTFSLSSLLLLYLSVGLFSLDLQQLQCMKSCWNKLWKSSSALFVISSV